MRICHLIELLQSLPADAQVAVDSTGRLREIEKIERVNLPGTSANAAGGQFIGFKIVLEVKS